MWNDNDDEKNKKVGKTHLHSFAFVDAALCLCNTYQLFKIIQSQSAVSAFLGVIGQISGNGSDLCKIPPKKTLHECITMNQTTTYLAGHSKNFKGIFLSFAVCVVISLCFC